uniref:Histidine--tRNA ligase, chloroplastic n=1 Tax=Calliarthron tuberculosum TaxID=48942 RepID=M4IUW8_CALTB|nr:histidine tRNA synthetase [Calliarthron tuberculosum]AGA63784.1 histidine tRNA synthetase [Calliarthron tuberculosum]
MQTIRGTKDILPDEINQWQQLYFEALELLTLHNYSEIRTPIIEPTELFIKGVGNDTDIINKEMYNFVDQGKRNITLRPEGTACIARACISNKLYVNNITQKLWYMGPMFRYERPQSGRQRQFHQLGIEHIGSEHPFTDVEIINLTHNLLQKLQCPAYTVEINSIGTQEERKKYKIALVNYLDKFKTELDLDSQRRLTTNPLRILDSKNIKTQLVLQNAPDINQYLGTASIKHFNTVCEYLNILDIPYTINNKLVRGLDYYSHTAFEIINDQLGTKNTICGGGRYSNLIKQLGGPNIPGVGCAIGIERLLMLIKNTSKRKENKNRFYLITQGYEADKKAWNLIKLLQQEKIKFNIDFNQDSFQKNIKKAIKNNALGCLIIGPDEIKNSTITIKWLEKNYQETISYNNIIKYLKQNINQSN